MGIYLGGITHHAPDVLQRKIQNALTQTVKNFFVNPKKKNERY